MVLIAVRNFRYEDSLGVYELPEGSLIIDLKAEIEATEGIPIGHQRLLRKQLDSQDLKDNENLDSLASDDSFKIIYLAQARIFYQLTRRLGDTIECNEASNFNFSLWESGIRVNLDEPIACRYQPQQHHDERTIVRAKYDWNGEIMHPNIKGLPLKHTALYTTLKLPRGHSSHGWLWGSPISPSDVNSRRLYAEVRGRFPKSFVSPVDGVADTSSISETIEQHLDVTSTEILDIPPLPPFHFPPASGMTFRMPISDKGHSFLMFTANYECVSSPVDPTHVTITLLCTTHDIRRISAVSVFITIPESALLNVQVCENGAHQKEIRTDKEVTETQLKGRHFDGINIGTHGTTVGFQGGVSRNYSLGSTEKGQQVSRRKVTARVDKEDTICWNLKAPTSNLDEDGLDGEESIILVLKKKPVEFKYNCRVTHARDGIEKTTQRITDRRTLWSMFSSR